MGLSTVLLVVAGITASNAGAVADGPWKVAPAEKHPRKALVLAADGRAITVRDGLMKVGMLQRLTQHVRDMDNTLGFWGTWAARAGLMVGGVGLVAAGFAALTGGLGFWLARSTPVAGFGGQDSRLQFMLDQAPGLALGGVVTILAGITTSIVVIFRVFWNASRGPSPPDPQIMDALGASILWDPVEAAEVVRVHNDGLVPEPGEGSRP